MCMLITITNSLWTWTLEYLITSNLSGHLTFVEERSCNVHESSRQDSSIRYTHDIYLCSVSLCPSADAECMNPPFFASPVSFAAVSPAQTKDYLHFSYALKGDTEMVCPDKVVISLLTSDHMYWVIRQYNKRTNKSQCWASDVKILIWQGKYGLYKHLSSLMGLTLLIFTFSIRV